MRNLLALIGLMVVIFFGVGYMRGWYTFSFTTSSDGKTDVNVKVDTVKVRNDASEGATKVGEAIESFKDRSKSAPTPPAGTPSPSTGVTTNVPSAATGFGK